MTYHPRFEAADSLLAASVPRSALPLSNEAPGSPGDPGTNIQRSDSELGLAHARLAHLFPEESFDLSCIDADGAGRRDIGLLAVVVAVLVVIVARMAS